MPTQAWGMAPARLPDSNCSMECPRSCGSGKVRQYGFDGRAIGRAAADMVEQNRSVAADQYVAAELRYVVGGPLGAPSAGHQFKINGDRRRAIQIPCTGTVHATRGGQLSTFVDQQRPGQPHIGGIRSRSRQRLEGDNQHCKIQLGDLRFMLLQLQQVLSARQSAQVAVKDQQQRPASVLLQAMHTTVAISQLEWHRQLAREVLPFRLFLHREISLASSSITIVGRLAGPRTRLRRPIGRTQPTTA